MTATQFETKITPTDAETWGAPRETHMAVAMAIYALAGDSRSPEDIWEAPTSDEFDNVKTEIGKLIASGLIDPDELGTYPWGAETIKI